MEVHQYARLCHIRYPSSRAACVPQSRTYPSGSLASLGAGQESKFVHKPSLCDQESTTPRPSMPFPTPLSFPLTKPSAIYLQAFQVLTQIKLYRFLSQGKIHKYECTKDIKHPIYSKQEIKSKLTLANLSQYWQEQGFKYAKLKNNASNNKISLDVG